jgi:hypothetical protein
MSGANQTVSGGIGGFIAFFLLALALWFLVRNMNTRLRNLSYREEAELAAAAAKGPLRAEAGARRDDQGGRKEVSREREDGQDVEHLVEPEPRG